MALDSGTSFDHIERHARATPELIAVAGPGRHISWARFRSDSVRFTQALAEFGIIPGQIVAVSHPDRYVHWLLAIGCEAIGAVFAPFAAGDAADNPSALLDLADIVLAERLLPGSNWRHIGYDWVAGVFAAANPPKSKSRRPAATPEESLRIVRTSGSTGAPKCMALPRIMQTRAVANVNFRATPPRYYSAYPLTVNPGHYRMEACLRLGGTVILGQASQDLVTYEATDCWLLPRDMVKLLEGLQGSWPSPQPLHISLGGGAVSAALHDATVSALGTDVQVFYATNETGFIGMLDREGVGTVLPEVDFQLLDEAGQALLTGEQGRIAIRTPGMVESYLRDPDATEASFRQGWFLSDDIGMQLADGRFRIIGRHSEILNLGGHKMPPAPIEDALRAHVPGLREVAVTSIVNAHGIEEICVAVVPNGAVDQSALMGAVQGTLPPSLGKFWLLCLEQLPVGASGKLQRSALRDIFAAALRT